MKKTKAEKEFIKHAQFIASYADKHTGDSNKSEFLILCVLKSLIDYKQKKIDELVSEKGDKVNEDTVITFTLSNKEILDAIDKRLMLLSRVVHTLEKIEEASNE